MTTSCSDDGYDDGRQMTWYGIWRKRKYTTPNDMCQASKKRPIQRFLRVTIPRPVPCCARKEAGFDAGVAQKHRQREQHVVVELGEVCDLRIGKLRCATRVTSE